MTIFNILVSLQEKLFENFNIKKYNSPTLSSLNFYNAGELGKTETIQIEKTEEKQACVYCDYKTICDR